MTDEAPHQAGSRAAARVRTLLVAVLLLGLAATASNVTYGAFQASIVNGSNAFATGSVTLADDDGGSALLALSSARPGATDTGCIRLTYSGTLTAEVRHYAAVTGALSPQLQLRVTRGTAGAAGFDSCTGFQADARDYHGDGPGVIYDGPLSDLPASYAGGIVDPEDTAGAGTPPTETWEGSEAHAYRYAVTLGGDASTEGQSAAATFRWEARNR